MYFKIVKDNVITDAGNTFLCWLKKTNTVIVCEPYRASYLSTVRGETYEAAWLRSPPPGAPRFTFVEAIQIDKEEYDKLKKELLSVESIPLPDIQEIIMEVAPEIKEEPQLLDAASATELLQELVKNYAEIKARNQFLEECILELSQDLYK